MIKLVIFDLDDTLINTQSFKSLRSTRQWDSLNDYLPHFTVMNDAEEAIKDLVSKEIKIAIITTSPRARYAEIVLNHFNIYYDNLYGYEDLKKGHDGIKNKTKTVCELMEKYEYTSDEVLFIGDSFNDYKACEETNCTFITFPGSEAFNDFDGKILSVNSYNELIDMIDQENGESIVHKIYHENFGEYLTFSHYIKDIFPEIPSKENKRFSFDSMHRRILEAKNNSPKSLINWISYFESIDLKQHFQAIDYVIRVLSSSETVIDKNNISSLDIIAFYFAKKLECSYNIEILKKIEPNEKLSHNNKNYDKRKEVISGKYKAENIQGKNLLVIDDIVTTGATMEEIKRAIQEADPENSVFPCSLAGTASFTDDLYIQNISSSKHFICGQAITQDAFDIYHYYLILYLQSILPLSHQSSYRSYNGVYGLFDTRELSILGKEETSFIYFNGYNTVENTYKLFYKNFGSVNEVETHYYPAFLKDNILNALNNFTS